MARAMRDVKELSTITNSSIKFDAKSYRISSLRLTIHQLKFEKFRKNGSVNKKHSEIQLYM